jgi:hypothetical protein
VGISSEMHWTFIKTKYWLTYSCSFSCRSHTTARNHRFSACSRTTCPHFVLLLNTQIMRTVGISATKGSRVDCVWNVMVHAQKPDFVFRRNGRVHLNRRGRQFRLWSMVSSVDYWQASCAHQPAGFVLLVQACVLQSRDAYWLHTPFSCFPFTSSPMRHRVPSHFTWLIPAFHLATRRP